MHVPRVAKAQPWAGISERFQRCSCRKVHRNTSLTISSLAPRYTVTEATDSSLDTPGWIETNGLSPMVNSGIERILVKQAKGRSNPGSQLKNRVTI